MSMKNPFGDKGGGDQPDQNMASGTTPSNTNTGDGIENESATQEEIIQFCKQHQASYKAPKSVVFINELPKTGTGKITKKALRKSYSKE